MTEKKVYILLTDTGTIFTKLIKLYTKKAYNHASISFDAELTQVYSFGRKKPRNPFVGGFVKEDVKRDLFKQADCVIYSFTVTEGQIKKMRRYIQRIEAQKEVYRYNFLGLFAFIFKKPVKREKAFFCSQFVATVLKECNIDFEKPPALMTPSDLQNVSKFLLVYEGKLMAYHNKDEAEVRVPVHFTPVEM